jgi:hypothetical protein
MPKVYTFIADGTEETELLCVVDILRRAGIDALTVSVGGATVTSSHGVKITADMTISDCAFDDADLLFVPGGMPGTQTLAADKTHDSRARRKRFFDDTFFRQNADTRDSRCAQKRQTRRRYLRRACARARCERLPRRKESDVLPDICG